MSKTLSFRGIVDMGVQQKINLRTMKGKTGYKITKLEIINKGTGTAAPELVFKIYSKPQTSFPATVDFSEGDLLGMAYYTSYTTGGANTSAIIFDNQVFNQDIYVYAEDAASGTDPCNYYIEIETISLSDVQSTQLTLKNLRTIASR